MLDVAGSTPVARSLERPRLVGALLVVENVVRVVLVEGSGWFRVLSARASSISASSSPLDTCASP
jgi:hypothetical protein